MSGRHNKGNNKRNQPHVSPPSASCPSNSLGLVEQFIAICPFATKAEAAAYIEIAGGEVELGAAIFASANVEKKDQGRSAVGGGVEGGGVNEEDTASKLLKRVGTNETATTDGDYGDGGEYHYEESDDCVDFGTDDGLDDGGDFTAGSADPITANSGDFSWQSNVQNCKIQPLSFQDVKEILTNKVNDLSNLVCWPFEKTHILLRHYEWNNEKAQEAYYDDPERCAKLVGVGANAEDDGALVFGQEGKDGGEENTIECGACWDDVLPSQAARLASCIHWFCMFCWSRGLQYKLDNEGVQGSVNAKCLSAKSGNANGGCMLKCSEKVFSQVLKQDHVDYWKRYQKFLIDDFITSQHEVYCFCPNPAEDCSYIMSYPQGQHLRSEFDLQKDKNFPNKAVWMAATVLCHCNYEYCFLCRKEAHLPCTCKEFLEWEAKEQDEGASAKWVVANTKNCPKCHKAVEKNGGCNHMTCSMCHLSWCWMCEQSLANHTSCTPPTAGDKKMQDRETAKSELQRYVFYFDRYKNHFHSRKLDSKVLEKVKRRITDDVTRTQCELSDMDYLEDTARTLFSCRRRLAFSYAYGYFLKPGCTKTALFEYNQTKLEVATELLSSILEDSKGLYTRADVVNRTSTAKTMLKNFSEA